MLGLSLILKRSPTTALPQYAHQFCKQHPIAWHGAYWLPLIAVGAAWSCCLPKPIGLTGVDVLTAVKYFATVVECHDLRSKCKHVRLTLIFTSTTGPRKTPLPDPNLPQIASCLSDCLRLPSGKITVTKSLPFGFFVGRCKGILAC